MKLRSWLLGTALLLGAVPVALAPQVACAAEGPHAVLVVDTGEGGSDYRFCVALGEAEVSGTELIELASEQHALSYRFGYGGNAVCELAGVGSEGDDCFDRYPDFWGYWRGDGSGGWTWSSSGPASTTVHDGDVEGWSWGRGNDGSTHPSPPSTTFRSVCGYSPVPPGGAGTGGDEEPEPRETKKPASNSGGEEGGDGPGTRNDPGSAQLEPEPGKTDDPAGLTSSDAREKRKEREAEAPRSPKKAIPTPTPDGEVALSADARVDEEGPPAAGLIGLVAAAVLVGAAVVFARRRDPGRS